MTKVAEFSIHDGDSDNHACERAFFLLNVGAEPGFMTADFPVVDEYRRRGNRSLSVGDVVAVDGTFYACQRIGWGKVPSISEVSKSAYGSAHLST